MTLLVWCPELGLRLESYDNGTVDTPGGSQDETYSHPGQVSTPLTPGRSQGKDQLVFKSVLRSVLETEDREGTETPGQGRGDGGGV